MKKTTTIRFSGAILIAYLCLPAVRAQNPSLPKVDTIPGHASPHVSVFTATAGFGRDPFFPKSTRFAPKAVIKTNDPLPAGELPPGMVLKGISGTKDRPLAIINNRTFAAGEEAELRIGLGIYRVRVVEIKESSAMVSVNGTPARELTLRANL